MSETKTDPIIIIGAGPTGLTSALALGLANIPVIVLEAEAALTRDLRAGAYHPPTQEILARLGVIDKMHETGYVVPHWQIRDRIEGVVANFDLTLLKGETPFPYRLHLEQHVLTDILLERIRTAAPSVTVEFGKRVNEVLADADGVTVYVGSEIYRGRYVIGCEGARSVVRQAMNVEFEGFTWPERYFAASTTYDLGSLGVTEAGYIADPVTWAAVFYVPDDGPPGLWRVVYPIQPEDDEAEEFKPETIQKRLFHLLGSANPRPSGGSFPLKYASVYKVHQRVASRFFEGRMIIAGDAAHLNNPLGALGLNGGVRDGANLADKLIEIWHNGADAETLLDRYDRQRRPINIKAVQAMSIRNKKLLEERDPEVRTRNLDDLRALTADPVRAKAYLMASSMINSIREAAQID